MTENEVRNKIKATISGRIRSIMAKRQMSKSELARRMGTSRTVIHRLLAKEDPSLTLTTLARAASALGIRVSIRLAI